MDIQVENALLKRALGYTIKEVTRERIVDTGQKQRHGGESELTERNGSLRLNILMAGAVIVARLWRNLQKDHIKPLVTAEH